MKRRRLLLVGFGVGVALLLLECVLQVAAFVIWARRGDDVVDLPAALLCVGDSFTYGLGATGDGGSYPRQLEARLAAGGQQLTVVNGAWPGQTSRDVLLRLPDQLRRHRPTTVCVLVGINDLHARPARVVEADFAQPPPSGFPLRLRSAQVLSLLWTWLVHERAGVPGFVGTWHQADLEVTFEPNGRVVLGKDEMRWMRDERGLVLVMPKGEVEPIAWSVTDDRLTLQAARFRYVLDRGAAPPPRELLRAQRALAAGDLPAAKALFEVAAQHGDDASPARAGLAAVAFAQGDRATAQALRDQLRVEFAAQRMVVRGEALLKAELVLADHAAAIAAAEQLLDIDASLLSAWEVLLSVGLANDQPRVLACMQRLLERAPADASWRPILLQTRAGLRRANEPEGALLDLYQAYLQTGDAAFLQRQLELGAASYSAARRDAALARLTPAEATRVRAALAQDVGEAGVYATLRAHLEHIAKLCKAHGAQLWLLSYPEPQPARDVLAAGVAAAVGARYVELHPRFAELLASTPRQQLFIADGHCTDRGYGVIAEELAKLWR